MQNKNMSLFALLLCFIFLVSLSSKTESHSVERRIKRDYKYYMDDPWNKPAWEQNDDDFPWREPLASVKRVHNGGTGGPHGTHILLENLL